VSETVVACVQMHADRPVADNIEVAERLVARAAARGAEVISLPERWNGTGPDERMVAAAEPLDGETAAAMAAWARQHGVWLHGGSIGEEAEPGVRACNTTLVFDPDGRRVATYRKIHMFDIDVAGAAARESNANKPGDRLVLAEIAGWPTGLTICYDLRFPEQYRELALAGAEAFVVPAGFTMATGRDHWEVLLRARAIENAAYVIAANQHGFWDGSARYARSMIIDPWGVVLANAGDGEGICVAAIDRARVAEVRRLIPVFSARRPEAYRLG
jgi:predicted amidohydrolase